MLLAIDTSSNDSGVALLDGGTIVAECAWHSGRRHAEQVLPTIDLLLHNLDATPADLRAVAVAIGPGSWSGLRVGISIAKALCIAHDLPIVGVSTLDILAFPFRGTVSRTVIPLVRLGRDRYGAATYVVDGDTLRRDGPLYNMSLDELRMFRGDIFVCGEIDDAARALLEQQPDTSVHFAAGIDAVRRPSALALLAWQRVQAGSIDDLATLEPIYLGSPVKEPTARSNDAPRTVGG